MTANSEFSTPLLSSREKSETAASSCSAQYIICKVTLQQTCHVGLRPADAGVLTKTWATQLVQQCPKALAASIGTIVSMA